MSRLTGFLGALLLAVTPPKEACIRVIRARAPRRHGGWSFPPHTIPRLFKLFFGIFLSIFALAANALTESVSPSQPAGWQMIYGLVFTTPAAACKSYETVIPNTGYTLGAFHAWYYDCVATLATGPYAGMTFVSGYTWLSRSATCPVPTVNPAVPYTYNPATGMCERSAQQSQACPANSQPSGTSCACNPGYEPYAYFWQMGCFATHACPAHAQGLGAACACDAGYHFDAAGTSCVSDCPIPDLSTDPNDPNGLQALSRLYDKTPEEAQLTQQLESNMDGYSLLSNDTQAAEQCLRGRMANKVSDYRVTSTVRTLAYQAHLLAVWKKFFDLQRAVAKNPAIQQMCSALIAKVEGEMGYRLDQDPTAKNESCAAAGRNHCIDRKPAATDPKHTQNLAFDISRTAVNQYESVLQPPATMATEANACNLTWGGIWPGTKQDRVHFLCCTKSFFVLRYYY